jgi:6-phosphogluconolactonase
MATPGDHGIGQTQPSSGVTRRQFLPLLGAAAFAATAPRVRIAAAASASGPEARFVYVGTYTAPGVPPGGTHPSTAVGISVFRLSPREGNLTLVQVVPAENPSYLALDPSLTHLYSVNEITAGRVSAYAINPVDGTLTFLNTALANGRDTTHLSVHPSGKYVMAASYTSGTFAVFRIQPDGSIGAMTDNVQDEGNGTGPNPDRQEGPHAHQIITDLDGLHVFGVDLGADQVVAFNLDLVTGRLAPNTVPFARIASGSGPRHTAFHPDRRHAYVLDELASTITAFDYDPVRGALVWLQTISTLPDRFNGTNTTAEIRVHPSGQFLYNTNRGHNSITMYAIDPDTGKLDVLDWQSTRGEWPRGMNIDPSGTFLYVGNQNTDTIVVFRVKDNGKLNQTAVVHTPTPVDIEFGPLA